MNPKKSIEMASLAIVSVREERDQLKEALNAALEGLQKMDDLRILEVANQSQDVLDEIKRIMKWP